MTREEAIKLLVNATYSKEWQGNEDLTTAHNMAIKALEQEFILDKIRAEIMQVANQEKFHDEKWALGLRYAVNIVDKYKKEMED